jgi:alkyl sulfatase BDS1-like metallo-beta-lactamase superfamily hydrolase
MTMGFRLPDVDEGFGLEVRRGVAQFHKFLPENADVVLEINRSTLNSLLLHDMDALGIDRYTRGNPPVRSDGCVTVREGPA